MTSISITEGDTELYDEIMADLRAGKDTKMKNFILSNYGWLFLKDAKHVYGDTLRSHSWDEAMSPVQSERLIGIYVTALQLLRDYVGVDPAGLEKGINGGIVVHGGEHLETIIFPAILEKMYGNTKQKDLTDLQKFFNHFSKQMDPKYGVVQSFLTLFDFNRYLSRLEKASSVKDGYESADYMKSLQLVFDNIIKGRSIVDTSKPSIDAFNEFGKAVCSNPYFKREYMANVRAARDIVQKDLISTRDFLSNQSQRSIQVYNGGHGYGHS